VFKGAGLKKKVINYYNNNTSAQGLGQAVPSLVIVRLGIFLRESISGRYPKTKK